MVHLNNGLLFSSKKKMSSSLEKRYKKLKCIMTRKKKGQCEKATYYMIPTRRHSENGRMIETVKGSVIARGQRERGVRRRSREEF